jgi:hypothetical protein
MEPLPALVLLALVECAGDIEAPSAPPPSGTTIVE